MTNIEHLSQEAKKFAGLNERFENETNEIRELRKSFAEIFDALQKNSEMMD